ncbi:hypothetical protein FOCC_FOCC007334 [Frankliniella occidentalis]|nr:hypothetical protein FOCC_FOCC007334 [Frankliniella occidentalis]
MMTSLSEVTTPAENLYNESQIRTRNPVKRLFGIWKRRFPVLALGISVSLDNTLPIIVAKAVLHNILRRRGEAQPPDDHELLAHLPMPWDDLLEFGRIRLQDHPAVTADKNVHRRALINDYFRTLQHIHQE